MNPLITPGDLAELLAVLAECGPTPTAAITCDVGGGNRETAGAGMPQGYFEHVRHHRDRGNRETAGAGMPPGTANNLQLLVVGGNRETAGAGMPRSSPCRALRPPAPVATARLPGRECHGRAGSVRRSEAGRGNRETAGAGMPLGCVRTGDAVEPLRGGNRETAGAGMPHSRRPPAP